MQYDKYELKVARLAKLLKLMFKHMTKIIISASVMLVTATTLLATRGIVSADECPSQITYGEKLEYSTSAFLSNTKLEYRKSGTDEWTEEVPTEVGAYNVRAVAKATFGYRYGNVESFTINPKEVHVIVSSKSVVYGEDPELTTALEYEDGIVCDDFTYTDDRTTTEPKISGIKIYDKGGKDVTGCYVISTESAKITTLKRPITIDVLDKSKTYDGTALKSDEYAITSGSIAKNDTLVMSFEKSIVNVGSVSNTSTFKILNSHGTDVTEFYSVQKNDGMLHVNKRPITFETASESVVYDGLSHSKESASVTSELGLVGDHTLVYENWQSFVEAGSFKNEASYKLVDKDGNSVEHNYDVTAIYGTVNIAKRPITIGTSSESVVYDGNTHGRWEYTVGGEGLAPAQTLNAYGWAELLDVGETDNSFSFDIFDKSGASKKHNYDITYNYGKISISKLPITVTTPTDTETYDGTEWYRDSLTYTPLAVGDEIRIADRTYVKNKGSYENVVAFDIYDSERGRSVKDNYEINVINGTLTVTARPLTVRSGSMTWTYNGAEYSYTDLTFAGDGIAASQVYSITEYARVLGVCKDVENKIIISIHAGEENVTDNYNISYEYGNLNVNKRDITVTLGDAEREYDGTPLYGNEPTVNNIVAGHNFSIIDRSSITNVGSCANEVYGYDILNATGESVLGNYNVSITDGTLTVTKRPIRLTTESKKAVYNSYPLTASGWLVSPLSPNKLVSGHVIVADAPTGSQTNVGKSENSYSGEVYIYADGVDVTANYDIIEIIPGMLEVTPRPITVVGGIYNDVYDGYDHFNIDLTTEGEYGLCDGHRFNVTSYETFNTVVTEAENRVTFEILDGDDVDVTSNYEIDYTPGTVTITPRPITVLGGGYNDIYDGMDHYNTELTVVGGYGLCDGHRFNVTGYETFNTVVTEAENRVTFEILDGSSTPVTSNYEIDYTPGTVTITPRSITVLGGGYNDIYDGMDHYNTELIVGGTYGLCSGHYLSVTDYEVFNSVVEEAENRVTFEILDGSGAPVTSNYEIDYTPGKVTISKRYITLTGEGYYDVYDGYDHYETNLTVGGAYGLCSGHYLNVTDYEVFNSVVEEAENKVTFEILDGSSTPVTSNYEIDYTPGTVTITPRPITVLGGGYNDIYDGMDHYNTELTVVGVYGLCDGHEINVTYYEIFNNVITDAENRVTFEILNTYGVNTAANYTIDYTPGRVTITKRDITVTLGDAEREYDGTPLYGNEPTVNNIVAGHNFSIIDRSSITNVGSCANEVYGYDILNATGESVLGNYNVSITDGTLTVTKRPIRLTTESKKAVYNSYPLTASGWLVSPLSPNKLVSGHVIVADAPTGSQTNVGKSENSYSGEVYIYADGVDVTANYDIIEIIPGMLEVTPRPITVVGGIYNDVYDGYDHFNIDLTTEGEYGLCDGHRFNVTSYETFNTVVTEAENRVTFEILDGDDVDVTSNYLVTYTPGTVTIEKRDVIVSTNGYEATYDGKDHSDYTLTVVLNEGGLPLCDGHRFEVIAEESTVIKNVVTNADNVVVFKILDADGNDVTSNYEVERRYGKINVSKRKLIVSTNGYNALYDGLDHSDYTLNIILDEDGLPLCDGHEFEVNAAESTVIKDVVTDADNVVVFKILDADGNDVTENYEIETRYGKVNVFKRKIIVSTNGYDGVYDGKEHSDHTLNVVLGEDGLSLYDGHRFEVITKESTVIKDVVTDADNVVVFKILDTDGNDVTKQYDTTDVRYGKINVLARQIYLYTSDYNGEYDGQSHAPEVFADTAKGYALCEGHRVSVKATIKNVVTNAENKAEEIKILDADGKDVTENYEIKDVESGKVTVTPRVVKIKTYNKIWQYNGLDNEFAEFEFLDGTSFVDGHEYKISATSIKDIGTKENLLKFTVMDGLENVTANYDIQLVEKGTLSVIPRNITVTSASDKKVYDGTPLTCDKMEVFEESERDLLPGHRIVATVNGTITAVGSTPNSYDEASVRIMNGDEDVTYLYSLDYECGTLTVLESDSEEEEEEEEKEDPNEPPYLSYDIGLPEDFDPNNMEIKTLFYVTSTANGRIYLKRSSLGDYTGRSWCVAENYDKLLFDYASAYYLTSYAIRNGNNTLHTAAIISVTGEYVLPYYSLDGSTNVQISDVYVNGYAGDEYFVNYYLNAGSISLPDELKDFEKKYSEFVHNQYLEISDSTKAFMLKLANEKGLNPQNPNIINSVANYIRGAAKYNLKYDRALDKCEDIAVAFLSQYPEGVCQHYATAATMMYRALGIPARYTVGYVGETIADTEVEITNLKGHAWVEVYMDGVGWIQVEVTGPGGIGGLEFEIDGPNNEEPDTEDPENPEKIKLTIRPKDQFKVFDGTPLYAKDEIVIPAALRDLMKMGYTFDVSVSGQIQYYGIDYSTVEEFVIYDPSNNDVTDQFEITFETGMLRIDKAQIQIYIYQKKHEYDGTDVTYSPDEYMVVYNDTGATFIMNSINVSMRDVGVLTAYDLNFSEDITAFLDYQVIDPETGMDITSSCSVYVCDFVNGENYDLVEITPRVITIMTGSATKAYDGTPLTSHTWSVTQGYFPPNHEIILTFNGTITDRGFTENTASKRSVKILDENGKNVKSNYIITLDFGELAVY